MAQLEFTHLEQEMIGLQTEIVQTMRKRGFVPIKTGALQKSIKPRPLVETKAGIQAPISFLYYGAIQNSPYGKHTGWIDRAEKVAVAKQDDAVAQAAAQDVADYLEVILPENVEVTI